VSIVSDFQAVERHADVIASNSWSKNNNGIHSVVSTHHPQKWLAKTIHWTSLRSDHETSKDKVAKRSHP